MVCLVILSNAFMIYILLVNQYNGCFTGAVPLATLNLQRGVKPGWTVPDAWHHQMVYGVSSKGIFLNLTINALLLLNLFKRKNMKYMPERHNPNLTV